MSARERCANAYTALQEPGLSFVAREQRLEALQAGLSELSAIERQFPGLIVHPADPMVAFEARAATIYPEVVLTDEDGDA